MRLGMTSHLVELGWRLGYFVFAWSLASVWCYIHALLFLYLGVKPLLILQNTTHSSFLCTHIAEAFYAHMSVGLWVGWFFVLPYLVYQVWAFVVPSLYGQERAWWSFLSCTSLWLWFGAFGVGYTLVVPALWSFLLSFELDAGAFTMHAHARMYEYLNSLYSVLTGLTVGIFGVALGFVFVYITRLSSTTLAGFRRLVCVLFLLLGALVSPPDLFSQLACAGFFVCMYEGCVFFASLREAYFHCDPT
uniref:SecY-independent transporter protein n=1 Tax=prasinophyte sp. MBIC10622 TaxID=156113 RepID=A0A650AKI4_9CHLO|nr:SecY-independent transporter protein [prasinophyte sp. MBIC10622]